MSLSNTDGNDRSGPFQQNSGHLRELTQNRIARVLFCIHNERMVLLHGFIKKTQRTPAADFELAMMRKRELV
jgi:phage-related protein